jgi:hypothetical protein
MAKTQNGSERSLRVAFASNRSAAQLSNRIVPTSSDRVIDGCTETGEEASSTPNRFAPWLSDRWRFWTAAILTHGKGHVHHLPEAWLILASGACMLTGDSPSGESIFVFKPDRPGSSFIGPIRQAARPSRHLPSQRGSSCPIRPAVHF